MFDIRKALVIVVIGILFAIFTHTLILAVHDRPDYNDFCKLEPKPRPLVELERRENLECPNIDAQVQECAAQDGQAMYDYDENGCPVFEECSFCNKDYNTAKEKYEWMYFLISSIMAIIAIVAGLLVPNKGVWEMVSSGFMLGGLIALFVGTGTYFGSMNRILKPFVMAIEIAIVIFVAWVKLSKK